MHKQRSGMDNLAACHRIATVPRMPRVRRPALSQPPILASQVTASRYFFLEQHGPSRAPLALLYGGFEQCRPDFLVRRDGFPCAVLEFVASGRGRVTINGVSVSVRAGSVFFYDRTARVELEADATNPMAKYFLSLDGRAIAARLRRNGIPRNGIAHVAFFAEVQEVLESLLREGARTRATRSAVCAALFEVLLLKLRELTHLDPLTREGSEAAFLRCKAAIDAQPRAFMRLEDISRAVGLGPSQLTRLFRRFQGTSPYHYLLHRKMALAAERLMQPNCLVKEAAEHVGFSDPYHFSRCFKQVHGISPQQLRRSAASS